MPSARNFEPLFYAPSAVPVQSRRRLPLSAGPLYNRTARRKGAPIPSKEARMDSSEELRRSFRTVLIIAVSILFTLLLFLALEEIMRARLKPFAGYAADGSPQTLRYLIFGLAVVVILLIRMIRGAMLRKRPNEDFAALTQRLVRASVVTFVLAEIPAVLGLMLFFLRGLNRDFYALLFVSLIVVFMHFPRLASWREWIDS